MSHRSDLPAARRFADALYAAALAENAVDPVSEDVVALRAVCEANASLLSRLADPKTRSHDRSALVLETLVPGRHRLVANLLGVLVARRREGLLGAFFVAFGATLERARGVLRVMVETAKPMTAPDTTDLEVRLASTTGRPVVLESRVRPEILGGMRLLIDSELIDGSIASRLERLRKKLVIAGTD